MNFVHAGTWNGPGNPDIDRPQNWVGNVLPDLTGSATAIFGTGGAEARINVNASFAGLVFNRDADFSIINGNGSLTVLGGGIQAGSPGATARTYTISESNLILGAAQTWSVTETSAATSLLVSGTVSGGAGASLTKSGSGTLTMSATAGNTYSGGTLLNAGTLVITNGSGSATGTGALTTAAGSVLAGSGVIAPASGNDMEAAGILVVGAANGGGAPAVLTLAVTSASVQLSATSELRIDLIGGYDSGVLNPGGTAPGSVNDVLSFAGSNNGTVQVGGTLSLQLANTGNWAEGSSWRLFDWSGITTLQGSFDTINGLPDLEDFDLFWDTSDLYTQGVLRVSLVPEPGRIGVMAFGFLLLLARRRRC